MSDPIEKQGHLAGELMHWRWDWIICASANHRFCRSRLSRFPPSQYPDSGISLPAVYLVWLGVLVILYPVCLWFADVKRRYHTPWLSYL